MKSAYLEAADTVDGVIKVLYHNGYRLALEESQEDDDEYCWYLSEVTDGGLRLVESGVSQSEDDAWEDGLYFLFSLDHYEPVLGAMKLMFPPIPMAWNEMNDGGLIELFFQKIGEWDTGIVTAYEEGPFIAYDGYFYHTPPTFFDALKIHMVEAPLAHSVLEAKNKDFRKWYFKQAP